MDLIQWVPNLPPRIDGIGDYALKLAHRLRDQHSIQTHFLVGNPHWTGPDIIEGFPARALDSRSPAAVRQALTQLPHAPHLLHFVVYGYHKRGCPVWLLNALTDLHASGTHLHTAFHELEAHSWKPWSSVFWTSPIQKSLLRRLARISTFRYTNLELHRNRLHRWGSGPVALIPNFSTLGEPQSLPPFAQRNRHLILFGRPAQRQLTLQHGGKHILPLCRLLGIERILDIGAPIPGHSLSDWQGIPITHTGRLSEAEIQHLFSTSLASFQHYPIHALGKSSIYAVSCAFGTLPFIHSDTPDLHACPPLVPGDDFFPVHFPHQPPQADHELFSNPTHLAHLSERLFHRYQMRNSAVAAQTIAAQLRR